MLEQTKRAIDNLKACGLKRSEFRVQAERKIIHGRDGNYVQYGHAQVTLFCSHARAAELTPELAKYFHVTHLIHGEKTYVSVKATDKVGFSERKI